MPKRSRSGEVRSRQVEFDGTRRRSLTDHDVELIILHRRIQHLFHDRCEAMDFIDEQHVLRLQVGQECGEIAGTLEHRT